MSITTYHAMAVLWGGVLLWELISGVALGTWRHPRIARNDTPRTYWFALGVQSAIFVAVLITGKSWHIR